MADPSPLHLALLRPPLLQILRAAGFTSAKPSTIDTLLDLTSRYLLLLATHTARHARSHSPLEYPPSPPQHPFDPYPPSAAEGQVTVADARLALHDVGALYPQVSVLEEQARGEEDMRGVEAFVAWCRGPSNAEIRRIAGYNPPNALDAVTGLEEQNLDFLSVLKRKHAKSGAGEEGRFAGTALGRDIEGKQVRIEGWEGVDCVREWERWLREKERGNEVGLRGGFGGDGAGDAEGDGEDVGGSESSGSPLTEISGISEGEG